MGWNWLIPVCLLAVAGIAAADMYVCPNPQGIIEFTNVPNRGGCRAVIRDGSNGSSVSIVAPGQLEDIILSAADRYGVDPHLVRAVIKAESDFKVQARSHKGAQGLMQLMPETARLHNVADVFNPDDNIGGGVRHLKLLLDRFQGDLNLVLAAYNAGIKAVEKYQGIPPFPETREYIRRVLAYLQRYRGNASASLSEYARR